MITITRDETSVEVSDEEVKKFVQLAIIQHFDTYLSVLKDKTRDSASTYPRRLYWYFLKYQYGLRNADIRIIDDSEFDSSAVTIQSEIVLLQQHYNRKIKADIEAIRKSLVLKEDYAFKMKRVI